MAKYRRLSHYVLKICPRCGRRRRFYEEITEDVGCIRYVCGKCGYKIYVLVSSECREDADWERREDVADPAKALFVWR